MSAASAGRSATRARYLSVSLAAATLNGLLYGALLTVTRLPAPVANSMAATVVVVPTYLAQRRWTWRVRSSRNLARHGFVYWGWSMGNVAASTAVAGRLSSASTPILVAATFGVYGISWCGRFLVLDRLLFARLARGTHRRLSEVSASNPAGSLTGRDRVPLR